MSDVLGPFSRYHRCQGRSYARRGQQRLHVHRSRQFDASPRGRSGTGSQTIKKVLETKKRATYPQASSLHYYSCAPGDAVDSVLGSFKIKRQSGLPVIDRQDRLVGIVTRSDLANREGEVVEDVMTESPVSILDSDSVTVALELMSQFEVDTLPVLDSLDGRCVGVITMNDVTKAKNGTGAGMDELLGTHERGSVDM